jgi:histidine ammonia-lyase
MAKSWSTQAPSSIQGLSIQPARLTLRDLRHIARSPDLALALDPGWEKPVEAAAATVADVVARGDAAYGINTGFGLLARKRIPNESLRELQTRLVLSHAAGTGAPLAPVTVRLILTLKAASLARGHSGVRPVVIESLLDLAKHGVLPVIPSKGSVGASGDLAPLAHLTAALIGIGEVTANGKTVPAAEGLAAAGLQPLVLEAKEGLALLNGTQVSTALALQGLFAAEDCLAAALVAGSLSVDAAKGSDVPFDRPYP